VILGDKAREWLTFFEEVFREARRIIHEQYKVEEDGSGSPQVLAIRKAIEGWPCPIRIAEIKVDTEKHNHIKDKVSQILRYDFSEMGEGGVEYPGLVDARDIEKLRELLVKRFNLRENWFDEFRKEFITTGWSDDEMSFVSQFPSYDIKGNLSRFVWDFIFIFRKFGGVFEKYRKVTDWNSKYNLKPDPILPLSELTRTDTNLRLSIEELQKDVCDIQLIPAVHEDVKRVFQHAKDLYIYGFFRYIFFTIAQHYAYLALESAVKNRYYQFFGPEITLSHKAESMKIGLLDHQVVVDLCRSIDNCDYQK